MSTTVNTVTGVTTLTGNTNVNISVQQALAYLMQTSLGPVTLTDQLPSILVTTAIAGDTQIGLGEDSTANAAQVVIDTPASGTNVFKVDATGTGSTAIGFQAASAASLSTLTINNNALLDIIATQTAIGAQIGSGSVTVHGFLEADSQQSATGVVVTGTGSVANTLQIHVQALNGVGVSFANASGASFTNSGSNSIMQVDALAGGSSVGIAFGGAYASGQWLTITNGGDLRAGVAIQALTSGVSSTPIVHLTNTGTIVGDIHLGIGPSALHGAGSQVINNGQISGNVYLDTNGDDLYDSSAGAGVATAVYLGSGTDTVHLGSAGGVVHGGTGAAVITGTTGAMTTYSGAGAETITGSSAADTFVFGPGLGADVITNFSDAQGDRIDLAPFITTIHTLNDVLALASQQGANTVITLGGGSVTLDNVSMASLTGADFVLPTVVTGTTANNFTATFQGAYLQYTVGAGGATVAGGPEGAYDDLVNIQHIKFVDGYLDYSATDPAGEVYRLYEATLGRGPDPEGLAGWVHALNAGTTLQSVANGFVTSTEFQNVYGALDDSHFVTLLYNNVLHRGPDQAGLTGWLGYLAQGHTRAEVVLGFSESAEDINDSAAAVGQGLWVGDVNAAQVARVYDTTLGRLPDITGLTGWTHALENGSMTLLQEVNGFMASAEFQAAYGSLDDTHFVTLLYNNTLHRGPDQAGLNGWLGYLAAGHSRAEVVLGFSESAEHIADTAPHIDNGIWLA